jgi:hypothetical protein
MDGRMSDNNVTCLSFFECFYIRTGRISSTLTVESLSFFGEIIDCPLDPVKWFHEAFRFHGINCRLWVVMEISFFLICKSPVHLDASQDFLLDRFAFYHLFFTKKFHWRTNLDDLETMTTNSAKSSRVYYNSLPLISVIIAKDAVFFLSLHLSYIYT